MCACVCVYVCAFARLQVFIFSLEEGEGINEKPSVYMLPNFLTIMSDTYIRCTKNKNIGKINIS